MADYYQAQRQYGGPLENNNGYAMPSYGSADYQGVQPQNKLIDIIDTYQMQPKQGQGMAPSKSTNALNDYYASMNGGNYQNGPTSPMQDYPAYPSPNQPMSLKAPTYEADYQGSASYRAPREILNKRFIQADDLRTHPGYGSINTMRNPMYANHNYIKQQQQQQASPSNPRKAPVFQDSIDAALNYNQPQSQVASYNSLSYRGEDAPAAGNYPREPLNKSRVPNDSQPKETLKYYNEEMFASPSARSKADDSYSSPNLRSKGYLHNLSSPSNADRHPTEYGVKLTSPIKRNPKDIYVFNPLTQTPLLRFQANHMLKKPDN